MIYKSTAVVAMAVASGIAGAQQQADQQTMQFVKTAIEGNIAEIQLGTLAGQRASSADVRELAGMIVNDHENALDESTGIAEDLGMEVPDEPSATAQKEYEQLARQSGSTFDRQFVDLMVKNHQSTIDKYRSFEQSADDGSAAAQYAESTLPKLEQHLEEARALDDQAQEQ